MEDLVQFLNSYFRLHYSACGSLKIFRIEDSRLVMYCFDLKKKIVLYDNIDLILKTKDREEIVKDIIYKVHEGV